MCGGAGTSAGVRPASASTPWITGTSSPRWRAERGTAPTPPTRWVSRAVSTAAVTGTTHVWSATDTTSASTTASDSGSRMRNVVPRPALVRTSTSPPSRLTCDRTTSRPTPRPDTSLTCSRVENPGENIRSTSSSSERDRAWSSEISPRRTAFAATRPRSMPAPSSDTSTTTWLPWW